jgi:hypothetical protein
MSGGDYGGGGDFGTDNTVSGYTSWWDRLMESIKSVAIGFVLFIVAFPLLFWNEGRAVSTAKSLAEGKGLVVSVSADKVDPANQGKLVHVTGPVKTNETLKDTEFGIEANAIFLLRSVEMYQYEEEKKTERKKKLGGGEETRTTYEYPVKWTSRKIDSTQFHDKSKVNPSVWPVAEASFAAKQVTLGAFVLTAAQVNDIRKQMDFSTTDGPQTLDTEALTKAKLPESIAKSAIIANSYIFVPTANSKSPQTNPSVGDVRIAFKVYRPSTISLIAKQVGESFEPYVTSNGRSLQLLELGSKSAELMFQEAEEANKILTWILRLIGFVVMAIGVAMVFSPLVVLADVLPIVGDILQAGSIIFAIVIALPLSLITIAIAWLFYRPVLGVGLIAAAVGIVVLGKMLFGKKKAG